MRFRALVELLCGPTCPKKAAQRHIIRMAKASLAAKTGSTPKSHKQLRHKAMAELNELVRNFSSHENVDPAAHLVTPSGRTGRQQVAVYAKN